MLPDHELDAFVREFAARVAALPVGVLEATIATVALEPALEESLQIANAEFGELFVRPLASERARSLIQAGAQTREGERDFERLINMLH